MSENDKKSPFGPGFVAACIVVGAVLVCGVLLLVSGPASGRSDASRGTTYSPATPDRGATQGSPPDGQTGSPARPVAGTGSATDRGAACGLPDGDQTVPAKAPSADGWEVSRRVVVPRSTAYGPAKTDADGFRRCYAHSPTGALFAAYGAMAALADQRQAIPTVQKLMVPGANTEALIRELRQEGSSSDSSATQLAGFQLLEAGPDRVTVLLAIPVESAYMSLSLTLVWYDQDWRVQPPLPGNPVGAPFTQHSDLGDFVAWSGV
jgi:hypothetical protein